MSDTLTEEEELREKAVVRLRKKADFKAHLLAYVLVNSFIVAIWAVTGWGYFWPIWPIMGWGIGVCFNAWDVYRRPDPTEHQIRREMDALREKRSY
jgi:2TM domain